MIPFPQQIRQSELFFPININKLIWALLNVDNDYRDLVKNTKYAHKTTEKQWFFFHCIYFYAPLTKTSRSDPISDDCRGRQFELMLANTGDLFAWVADNARCYRDKVR